MENFKLIVNIYKDVSKSFEREQKAYILKDMDFDSANKIATAYFLQTISELKNVQHINFIRSTDKCKKQGTHSFEIVYKLMGDKVRGRRMTFYLRPDGAEELVLPNENFLSLAEKFFTKQRKMNRCICSMGIERDDSDPFPIIMRKLTIDKILKRIPNNDFIK